MGLTNRITTLLKQKVNTLLNKYEDPKEALDYSYQNQIETMNKLRRCIAEVVTADEAADAKDKVSRLCASTAKRKGVC